MTKVVRQWIRYLATVYIDTLPSCAGSNVLEAGGIRVIFLHVHMTGIIHYMTELLITWLYPPYIHVVHTS